MFKGIFTALLTPFDKENKINEKALEALIKHNLSMGVKEIVPFVKEVR